MYKVLVTLSDSSRKVLEGEREYIDFRLAVQDYRDLFRMVEKTIKKKPFMVLRCIQITLVEE